MLRRAGSHALTLAIAFAVGAPTAHAQRGAGGTAGAGGASGGGDLYTAEVQRLSRASAQLAREYANQAAVARALRVADSSLRHLDAGDLAATARLGLVMNRLASGTGQALGADPRLQDLVTGVASLRARLAYDDALRSVAPAGWMGLSYSGAPPRADQGRGTYFYYDEYPVVVSVEPGSPAEQAGLEAGDTILAYNGLDVRGRPIYARQLLRPGTRVGVRVRRDGRTLDVLVPVARRPRMFVTDVAPFTATLAPAMPAGSLRVDARTIAPPAAVAPPRAPAVYAPPAPVTPLPATGYAFAFSTDDAAVAGAQVAVMSEDLRDALGVTDRGVLVLNVARGTPASESGLRGGDVIVSAGGQPVATPLALRRAIARAGDDRALRLDVVRKRKRMTVELRWDQPDDR